MDNKRGDFASLSTKAQITIFMILGLIILFVFLFVIQLSVRVNQEKLDISKEKVFDTAFKKEGLRLYVDDCLQDELEKGLLLLGRQGRLWADQPGGRLNFEPGRSGIVYAPGEQVSEFDSSRVAYGLTRKTYIEHENAYPCLDEGQDPEFCRYKFPNTTLGFGSLELLPSTLKGDLQRFMTNRTGWCVQQFVLNNISRQAVIESSPAEVSIDIVDDGISVTSEYPLRFTLGQNEFFHLSTFDFFYPSQFGKLLNDIITFPLQQDQRYLDFNYSPERLDKQSFKFASDVDLGRNCHQVDNYFICERSLRHETMKALGIEMTAERMADGNDVFSFRPALYKIVNSPEPFVFRVARQNRPPALDYIERGSCPIAGYDYLVIKDHPLLGGINISVFALDPDEDSLAYQYITPPALSALTPTQNMSEEVVNNLVARKYEFTANVTDEQGRSDWQNVRILVDRPMETSVSLESPYKDVSYADPADHTFYRISKEDPVYLKFHVPQPSVDPTAQPVPTEFYYTDGMGGEPFDFKPPEGLPEGDSCYNLPKSISIDGEAGPVSCGTLEGYTNEDIGFPRSKFPQHPFRTTTANGNLLLKYATNYCGATEPLGKSTVLKVRVEECVPYRNATHPWGYNREEHYEKYTYGVDAQGKTNYTKYLGTGENINPFETTHACCLETWKIATPADEKECFVNPEPGCYGQISGLTTKEENKRYVLETQIRLCDGGSGIVCRGDFGNELYLHNNKMWCGKGGLCGNVETQCADQQAFNITGNGWCAGTMGCQFIKREIVYTGILAPAQVNANLINLEATNLAQQGKTPGGDSEFDFRAGCTSDDVRLRRICDANFDGRFTGRCEEKDGVVSCHES